MIGLVAAYYWGKDRARAADRRAEAAGDDEWGWWPMLVIVPVAITVAMPYLVWQAVVQNGRGRWTAGWFVAVATSVAALVGALAGWWWVPAVVLAEGIAAVVHIGVRAYRDRKAEERYM